MTTTFYKTPKDDDKDRIQVEIGDSKQPDFKPQFKVIRWDNEVNFSARFLDIEKISPKEIDGRISVESKNKKIELYELSEQEIDGGGFEFEITLKEKPSSNVLRFSIQDKGVEYYYQPPLTQKEIDWGAHRPDNIVGSYAIYSKTHKINLSNGKEYKTGKIGHIYRPRVEDSNGNWVWGELNISGGILTVTIPQDFLNKAVYPVRHAAGLTFGYTSVGASAVDGSSFGVGGYKFAGAAGTATSMSAYIIDQYTYNGNPPSFSQLGSGGPDWTFAIYKDSDNSKVGVSDQHNADGLETPGWQTLSLSTTPTISAVDYWLYNEIGNSPNSWNNYVYWKFDSGASLNARFGHNYYTTWPSTLSSSDFAVTNQAWIFSIYTTYTGGGSVENASVSPSTITLSGVSPTATYAEVKNASVSTSTITLSGVSPTPTYLEVDSASVSPETLNITAQSPTATYEEVDSASVSPLTVTLTAISPTATVAEIYNAAVSPETITLTGVSPTATYVGVWNAVVSPGTITISGVSPTATYAEVDDASVSVETLTISAISPTATYSEVYSAAVAPETLTISGVSPTATRYEVYNASVSPETITLSAVSPTATYPSSIFNASVTPATLTLSAVTPVVSATVTEFVYDLINIDGKYIAKHINGDYYTII